MSQGLIGRRDEDQEVHLFPSVVLFLLDFSIIII